MRAVALVSLAITLLVVGVARGDEGPAVVAHRGARAHAPGNSLRAFRLARAEGASGVELDVRLSRDGAVVIHHDRKVLLPSGKEVPVSRLTLAELQQIDLGGGQRIPTLEQALAVTAPELTVNVEIKAESPRTRGLERKVVAAVRAAGAGKRVSISSFNPISIRRVQRLAPELRTAILVQKYAGWRVPAWISRARDINPNARMISARRVKDWHDRGFERVNTWTVNSVREVERVMAAGVDTIMTDDPEAVRAAVDARLSRAADRSASTRMSRMRALERRGRGFGARARVLKARGRAAIRRGARAVGQGGIGAGAIPAHPALAR